jgi:hypothetical protein
VVWWLSTTNARLKELSRMMAGLENSDAAQAHAEELLALAAERHNPRKKSRFQRIDLTHSHCYFSA